MNIGSLLSGIAVLAWLGAGAALVLTLTRAARGQALRNGGIIILAALLFSVDPASIIKVHIAWQGRYAEELIRPQSRGIIRDVVSQYGVDAIVSSKREEMSSLISETLRTKLAENGILMDAFILRNITFSEEYAASVEQKQIAEQLAKQAAFVVEQRR